MANDCLCLLELVLEELFVLLGEDEDGLRLLVKMQVGQFEEDGNLCLCVG